MSAAEKLVFDEVRACNGISAYMLTIRINREYGEFFTRKQVSGILQRLRLRGKAEHFGGWTATKDSHAS